MIKKLVFLLLLLIVLLPLASGLEVCIDKYDLGAGNGGSSYLLAALHPSSSTTKSAFGQSFRSYFDGANLTVLQVRMYQSAANGFCTAKIQGHTGLFGSGTPNGTVLATSDAVNITNPAMAIINFSFPSGLIMDSAENYFWTIETTSGDVASFIYDLDDTGLINHIGNGVQYYSSAWNTIAYDAPFILYATDGTAVSFNFSNGDVTINENTNIYNVTATGEVTATGAVTAGAVTAGDITASGGVTVDTVTASFNNTAVTAGDVNAAGAVTANGAITLEGDLSVNGTFDNATLTYATSSAVSGDANVYFLIAFIALAVLLTFYNKVPFVVCVLS